VSRELLVDKTLPHLPPTVQIMYRSYFCDLYLIRLGFKYQIVFAYYDKFMTVELLGQFTQR